MSRFTESVLNIHINHIITGVQLTLSIFIHILLSNKLTTNKLLVYSLEQLDIAPLAKRKAKELGIGVSHSMRLAVQKLLSDSIAAWQSSSVVGSHSPEFPTPPLTASQTWPSTRILLRHIALPYGFHPRID